MEAVSLAVYVLGPLLLPLLAVLLMALCVRCRELPGSYDTAVSDSLTPSSIMIKLPPTLVPRPSTTPYPLPSQPDLLPIPRSPQPLGGSHRMASSRQDSDSANSVASYENEGVTGTPVAPAGRRLRPVLGSADPVSLPPEAACEDADEDDYDEDYNNEGYLVVLPDRDPATSTGNAVSPAPASSKPGLRDSAFSMESGEDYVNVPESEESADASLSECGGPSWCPPGVCHPSLPPSCPPTPSSLSCHPGVSVSSPLPSVAPSPSAWVSSCSPPPCGLSPFGCGCPSF
ncbi:linker for activation of T-cells family member 1 isoform X2 [Moschus berezovskii]|uniref:linker for activation of T-cells family member 1 isoform X2 n=1 Tax=Moschus berezovskii TaxID=68408 RepID=UPI002444E4F8|nr:linker for activation of T-cells family member 1 isoform X2 [Moschus berezovskii]